SVASAVKEWLPGAKLPANVQAPAPLAVAVPRMAAPSATVTMASASALPATVNAVALVMPSDAEAPLSGLMALMVGAAGGLVSMMTEKALEASLRLPAMSVALAVRSWLPAARLLARLQAPDPSAVAVPIVLAPSLTVTMALASALPEIVCAV